MFPLLRYFSITCAIACLAATAFMVTKSRATAFDHVREMREESNVEIVRILKNAIWPVYGPYLTSVAPRNDEEPRADPMALNLRKLIRNHLEGLTILDLKIYSSQGLPVFSTEHSQIGHGHDLSSPIGVASALSGKTASELTRRNTFSTFGRIVEDVDVISTFVPVFGPDGKVEAVIEVHEDVTTKMDSFHRDLIATGFGIIGIFLLLYLALFLIVRHAGRTLRHQHRQILVNQTELEEEVGERKGAEEALRQSESRFRDFADAASDWFWEMDENLHFSYFSERFTEVTGVPQEALLGKTREETGVPDVDKDEWQNHLADLAAHKSFRDFRHPRNHPDGRTVHLSINGKAISDEAGNFKGYRGSGSDITERKRAEEALYELNKDLERSVAELHEAQEDLLRKQRLADLGQIMGTVAHELRNPLGVIRNSVSLIAETVEEAGLNLNRPLERTQRNISRCEGIIGELLDYTRARKLEAEPTAIDAWLQSVLDEQTVPRGIELRRDFGAGEAEVPFDADRIRRVVINLFDNACQAMAGAKTERCLTVATRVSNERLEISFSDTGPGIEEEHLAKIFEPLFTTKRYGVGLGLPMVKQIMEQHGGGIDISSHSGGGTRVTLWLPIPSAAEEAA